MSIEIAKCPCCESPSDLLFNEESFLLGGHYVQCSECGLTTQDYETEEAALESWNRRPSNQYAEELQQIAEALKMPFSPGRKVVQRVRELIGQPSLV